MKQYNTPHRSRVVKTRMTEEEYADFTERLQPYDIRKVTAYAQKHEARFVKLLIQQNEMGGKRKLAAAAKQLEQVQSRIAELSRYIKRLYEDNVNGKISDERFMEMSADYEAEQRELKEKAAALQGELDKAQESHRKRREIYERCPQVPFYRRTDPHPLA